MTFLLEIEGGNVCCSNPGPEAWGWLGFLDMSLGKMIRPCPRTPRPYGQSRAVWPQLYCCVALGKSLHLLDLHHLLWSWGGAH